MARADEPQQESNAKADLHLAERQASAIISIAADAIVALDEQFRITLFNDGAAVIFGFSLREVIGEPLDLLIPERFHSTHHHHVAEFSKASIAARRMGQRQEIFARRKDGTEFPAEASIAKQEIDGKRTFMVVLRDVSERKLAETALARANSELEVRVIQRTRALEAEVHRREEAQAALIQAQRMEAFGQLTGGIAHDFNNLLTIITGNLELLADRTQGEESRILLKRASDAADMGAALTKHLLTFARRRQLSPQLVDLNEMVLGLMEILKRSLGEPITLTTMLTGNIWKTRADASEVENAILNLAINARDAMPDGGTLVVETRNISAADAPAELRGGDYVLLSVSDTGQGMTSEVLERAFEPFFTTKGPGRGTGLGLSTLYGFAEQSDGLASISSEVGKGTTVDLYLPRAGAAEEVTSAGKDESLPLSESSEVILVVEDNPGVRELALQRVEGLGYVVLEAENGPAAVRILESGATVDLVLSDIVMAGGMSGYDLVRWVREHAPGVRVLLTTGYAEQEAKGSPGELASVPILRKPYKRAELAIELRNALRT